MDKITQAELVYIAKVLRSCETNEQRENALLWVWEWINRQKHKFTSQKWHEFYSSVVKTLDI